MVDTGWKHPLNVVQDSRKALNNGLSCYAFVNINNIKKNDKTYADQQPWAYTGVDTDHKSPMVYAYNYGFSIPKDAVVDKITLYAMVNQLTHPKYYYEHYVLKRQLRFSTSKFYNVKLKQGSSTVDGGSGNNMASKCSVQMLPYQEWSTEDTTTFSGTPTQWGITSKDVPSVINSGNFGVAVQFIGTVKNGWCNPAIAQLRMKVEYTIPELKNTTPSEFTKITVTHNGDEVKFSNNISDAEFELEYGVYTTPIILSFNFHHKGNAGETPIITFDSSSLIMGATANSYANKKTYTGKYTMPSLHCGTDDKVKVYTQTLAVFPGILLGDQTINYKLNGKNYVLRFDVKSRLDEADRAKFLNKNQQCMIQNCWFKRNKTVRVGGANYITSEFYYPTGNTYVENVAENKYNDNGGNGCNNTYWLGNCNND